jgi:hypothetical protein
VSAARADCAVRLRRYPKWSGSRRGRGPQGSDEAKKHRRLYVRQCAGNVDPTEARRTKGATDSVSSPPAPWRDLIESPHSEQPHQPPTSNWTKPVMLNVAPLFPCWRVKIGRLWPTSGVVIRARPDRGDQHGAALRRSVRRRHDKRRTVSARVRPRDPGAAPPRRARCLRACILHGIHR